MSHCVLLMCSPWCRLTSPGSEHSLGHCLCKSSSRKVQRLRKSELVLTVTPDSGQADRAFPLFKKERGFRGPRTLTLLRRGFWTHSQHSDQRRQVRLRPSGRAAVLGEAALLTATLRTWAHLPVF